MNLAGGAFEGLQSALDVTAARQRVIAANLANVNTPGYKAKDVKFDGELKKIMTVDRETGATRQDGNSVVMELEHAAMTKNALAYRVFLVSMAHGVRMSRAAISGRSQ